MRRVTGYAVACGMDGQALVDHMLDSHHDRAWRAWNCAGRSTVIAIRRDPQFGQRIRADSAETGRPLPLSISALGDRPVHADRSAGPISDLRGRSRGTVRTAPTNSWGRTSKTDASIHSGDGGVRYLGNQRLGPRGTTPPTPANGSQYLTQPACTAPVLQPLPGPHVWPRRFSERAIAAPVPQ